MGGCEKPIYRGLLPEKRRRLGEFADLRVGLAEEGGGVSEGAG